MLTLVTGRPGSGKTLHVVERLVKNSEQSERPVFTNINGLDYSRLPNCFPIEEPKEWFNYPDGSLIVLDECQRFFPVRPNGSQVPDHVSQLETHRHRGIDIILITQHPTLIDHHVRKLVEEHVHVRRIAGSKLRNILKWDMCVDQPDPSQGFKTGTQSRERLNPKVYDYYQSATIHTHKSRIWQRYGIWILLIVIFSVMTIWLFSYAFRTIGVFGSDEANGYSEQESFIESVSDSAPVISKREYFPLRFVGSFIDRNGIGVIWFSPIPIEEKSSSVSEDSPQPGYEDYFFLDDFDFYEKKPPRTVLLSYGGDFYEVRSHELYSILP